MVWLRRCRAAAAAGVAIFASAASGQTWTACNPLHGTCPPDTALGMAIDVDFTQGEVNSFVASGGAVSYGSDGASFTVAAAGQAPQLTSVFYIMFGRVEVTMKAAPGAGIVSSLVLQSDCLDEIDMEWLGADDTEVQTNYFGKGQTGSYNRGQFNPAPNNQAEYIKYTIDWTSERIIWSVGGTEIRRLSYGDAAPGEYPQTPMQVKFGAWSGGDASNNPPGTVDWARGPTDYSQGPFSMLVKAALVSDYSTGKTYTYGDTSGTWESIQAEGGQVNGNLGNAGSLTITASASAVTSSTPTVPAGGIGKGTQTGWPWEPTGTGETQGGTIPDGWRMTPSGKIIPASSSINPQMSFSSPAPSPSGGSSQLPPGGGGADDGGASGFTTATTTNNSPLGSSTTVPQAPSRDENAAAVQQLAGRLPSAAVVAFIGCLALLL